MALGVFLFICSNAILFFLIFPVPVTTNNFIESCTAIESDAETGLQRLTMFGPLYVPDVSRWRGTMNTPGPDGAVA